MHQITKLCTDHLRTFSQNHGIKLKSCHAHELVAACFGYQSRAALLAENKQYSLNNLPQASIIVLTPSSFIDKRLKNLEGLPPNLPDTLTLHEAIYNRLVLEKILTSHFWSYHDLERQAAILGYEYLYQSQLKKIQPSPSLDKVTREISDEGIYLTVIRQEPIDPLFDRYKGTTRYEQIKITIWLQRIAAHIGYAKPEISFMSHPHTQFNVEGYNHD